MQQHHLFKWDEPILINSAIHSVTFLTDNHHFCPMMSEDETACFFLNITDFESMRVENVLTIDFIHVQYNCKVTKWFYFNLDNLLIMRIMRTFFAVCLSRKI